MSNTAPNVEQTLRDLLMRGVQATEAEHRRTRLDDITEKSPDDWTEHEWDFANQRGLIPPERQAEYELRLLEKRQAAERAALLGWQGANLPHTGTATQGVASGQIPAVPERPVSASLVQEVDGSDSPPDEDEPYTAWTVQELQDEIGSRNETRPDPATHVRAASGRKADLVTALETDDASQASE